MATLIVDGRRVNYLDVGSGLPVVLMHAFPLTSAAFEAQTAALRDRFRFILPDARGFGGSELGAPITQMTDLAEDAIAILDELGIDEAVVGGVSMGGYASLALAREMPSRVKALVLADTQATADDEAAKAGRQALLSAVDADGIEALLQRQLPKLLATAEARVPVEALIRSANVQAVEAAIRGLAQREDSRGILARFSGPTLILVGERDEVTPRAKAEQMQELIPGSILVEIPGGGHLAHLDKPGAFNQALGSFLAGL